MIADAYLWLYIQYTRLRLWYYSAALESMMHNDPLHNDPHRFPCMCTTSANSCATSSDRHADTPEPLGLPLSPPPHLPRPAPNAAAAMVEHIDRLESQA